MYDKIEPSEAQNITLQNTGIKSVEELAYADLRHSGWSKEDALKLAFAGMYDTYTQRDRREVVKELEEDKEIRRRIERLDGSETASNTRISLKDLAAETSKEKILADLVIARRNTRQGTREWSDLTKMLADYAKIKQDDIKTDEQPIRYYIPAHYPTSCRNCLIGQNKKKNAQ